MKQGIQEGFILDVLKTYTPVDSYYKLVKTVESDPEFDTGRHFAARRWEPKAQYLPRFTLTRDSTSSANSVSSTLFQ
jgi:hypothetical protein